MENGDKGEEFVNVAIRIRPRNSADTTPKVCLEVIPSNPSVLYVAEKRLSYSFDHVLEEKCDQEDVYNAMVKPLIGRVIAGYNSTVFAYGQTGTGKTYTIGTDPKRYEDAGLISRTINDIMYQTDENREVSISVSFLEIYNEKVFDLLGNNMVPLPIKGFKVAGMTKLHVVHAEQALQALRDGGKNRHVGETKQNSNSSRSHAIFTIHCNVKHSNHETDAKLNLVDLAGSESVKKTGNEGSQLHEGININKGLLSIGQVINALSSNQLYVPYRQSTITTILQDSLNKRNYVTLIACVSPNLEDVHETVQTLDFAQRAKRLRSKPELNNIVSKHTLQRSAQKQPSAKKWLQTPRVASTLLSSRKQLEFRTPARAYSTTSIPRTTEPLHSTLMADIATPANFSDLSMASTILGGHDSTAVNLSPIVKKCVAAVESSILDKLQGMIRDSILATPARSSPRFSRAQLQEELSKIVQSEIRSLAGQMDPVTKPISRAETPNYENDMMVSLHMVPSQTPKNETDNMEPNASPIESKDGSPVFKVPAIPMMSNMKTSSPKVRRSLRLSVKHLTLPSKRWSAMRNSPPTNSPIPLPRTKKTSTKAAANKSKGSTKKPLNNIGTIEKTKKVLKILNSGNEKELQKLSMVGPKTAAMLLDFRDVRGKIRKISDLQEMPWSAGAYRRFVESNFVLEV